MAQDMKVVYSYVTSDGRLERIETTSYEDDSDAFTYTYGATGQLAPTLLKGENLGGTPNDQHMYTSVGYENDVVVLNYVQNKTSSAGSIVSKYDYDYSNIGLRNKKTLSGSAFTATTYDEYDYNSRHELTDSIRCNSGTPVTGKEYSYNYDNIGNRLDWYDGSSNMVDKTTCTPTSLHQYSGITGKHAESPITYDGDGNLTDLDTVDYVYDGENRLIEVKNSGSTVVTFKYDYLGRRTEKDVVSGSTYTYLYDGWNLIAVYDDDSGNHEPLITYNWGLDLSQSIQGAGGVGGIPMSSERSGSAWSYYQDGHGNVSQVIAQSNGATTVKMEYDPYGRVISGSPGTGLRDEFRFSSKYYDSEIGLYYYGYRYLDPVHGRWLNRDPIGERGGWNLYSFVGNSGIIAVDYLGMCTVGATATTIVATPRWGVRGPIFPWRIPSGPGRTPPVPLVQVLIWEDCFQDRVCVKKCFLWFEWTEWNDFGLPYGCREREGGVLFNGVPFADLRPLPRIRWMDPIGRPN